MPLALTGLAIFPGLWLWGGYSYPYTHPFTFHNYTAVNSTNPNGVNQTLPVDCLCQMYAECGCDDNTDPSFIDDLVGNGSYTALNKSVITVADVNGTSTILLNGTLPNGTTATGGTESANAGTRLVAELSGWWIVGAVVVYTLWFI